MSNISAEDDIGKKEFNFLLSNATILSTIKAHTAAFSKETKNVKQDFKKIQV